MKPNVLVAGIGNIFLQDDGFGVEVAQRLGAEPFPEVVRVTDFGIRGIHLAYELLEQKYDLTVLVDAIVRGGKPGTLYLVEPDLESSQATEEVTADAHAMTPQHVFQLLPVTRRLAGTGPKRGAPLKLPGSNAFGVVEYFIQVLLVDVPDPRQFDGEIAESSRPNSRLG